MKRLCRLISFLTFLVSCFLCSGCWDYRGLNQLTIVAGFTLDEAPDGGFLLSMEIIDASSSGKTPISSKLIQSKGNTIADAVYNAGTQFYNNVYFGNADVLILSNSLVAKTGLYDLIDPLMRDNGMRDNLVVLVSGEETAYQLITPAEEEDVISFNIKDKIINNRSAVTVTRSKELYEIYGILSRQTSDLVLPVIRFNHPEEKKLVLDGLKLFRSNRLAGELPQDQMQTYLLAVESLKGGGYVLEKAGENGEVARVTVAIRSSKPQLAYAYENGRLKYTLHICLQTSAVEYNAEAFAVYQNDTKGVRKLQTDLEESISDSVQTLIQTYLQQHAEPADIFGFADAVYYKDPALWKQLKSDWSTHYRNAEVTVHCSVQVYDTGLIKRH